MPIKIQIFHYFLRLYCGDIGSFYKNLSEFDLYLMNFSVFLLICSFIFSWFCMQKFNYVAKFNYI